MNIEKEGACTEVVCGLLPIPMICGGINGYLIDVCQFKITNFAMIERGRMLPASLSPNSSFRLHPYQEVIDRQLPPTKQEVIHV
jgi:hypothetical protein